MPDVPSLQTIAMCTSIRHLWKCSRLPYLYASSMRATKRGRGAGIIESEISVYISAVQKIKLTECILPHFLAVRWNIAFERLCSEIKIFLERLTDSIRCCRVKHIIRYIISKLQITQEGRLDCAATVIKFLLDTKFGYPLKENFTNHYNINVNKLREIMDEAAKDSDKRSESFKKKLMNITRNSDGKDMSTVNSEIQTDTLIKMFKMDVEECITLDAYLRYDDICKRKTFDHLQVSTLQYVANTGDVGALKCCYNTIPADRRQEELIKAVKFVLHTGNATCDVIIFFYENIEDNLWIQIVDGYYLELFEILIKCWRHRHLCASFFDIVSSSVDLNYYELILSSTRDAYSGNKYEYYDIMTTFKHIWQKTPDHIKQEDRMRLVLIPDFILFKSDFEYRTFLLESYNTERQLEILYQVILSLYMNENWYLVRQCLDATSYLGPHIVNCLKTMNIGVLKTYLMNRTYKFYSVRMLNSTISELRVTDDDVASFKAELLQDKMFISKYLDRFLRGEPRELITWLQTKALHPKLFEKTFSKSMECSDPEIIWDEIKPHFQKRENEVLFRRTLLQWPTYGEEHAIKHIISKHPSILNKLYSSLIDFDGFYRIQHDLLLRCDSKGPLQTFFQSDEGKKAILDLFLSISNVEADVTLRAPLDNVIRFMNDFKRVVIDKYDLKSIVCDLIDEIGHPNAPPRRKITVKPLNREPRPWEEETARQVVDAYYRFFVAIMKGPADFITNELWQSTGELDITACSLRFMDAARVRVPVVL